jgi:thioredoxin reductase
LHCPYCHGYAVRDQPLGVLGSGPRSVHQALLVRQLSRDVVLFRHTLGDLSAQDAARLTARDVRVVDGEVTGLIIEGDRLAGVQLADGRVLARSALFVTLHFVANADVVDGLAVETESTPLGTWIKAASGGRTSVPGVWVVGNVADIGGFAIEAAAAGARAGAAINADLVDEEVERATYEHARVPAASAP